MTRTVLVPIDGSDHSYGALSLAFDQYDGDEFLVVHVVDPNVGEYAHDTPGGTDRKKSEVILEEATEQFEAHATPDSSLETAVEEGKPKRIVLDYANRDDVDQVVMGTRGMTGVKRLVLGSVADAIIRQSDVPVNVVPQQAVDS